MSATRIVDGIEWFDEDGAFSRHGEQDCQCARCGSSVEWLRCWNCGGEGYSHHDCGEDSCCCLYPEDNVVCHACIGAGGSWHCISGHEWCTAHPMAGRDGVASTALNSEAWRDA